MPQFISSQYVTRPFFMLNAHFETVVPSLFFKVKEQLYTREKIELNDGDFLNLDWIKNKHKRCMILTHGLEGDSERYYMKRAAKYFSESGWDILAWNCRSCGGEMNRLARFYHHGDTADLNVVVKKALEQGYESIVLVGYSMGGSMTLKYFGENERDPRVKGATVFSVPCNLRDSAEQLRIPKNRFYEKRFLSKLVEKIKIKSTLHDDIDGGSADDLVDFDQFHDKYTAPLHGFSSKEDFFQQATCDQFLKDIKVPVLIVNAANDPMLGELCYPKEIADQSPFVFLEIPEKGGHVGFTLSGKKHSYMEMRAEEFIAQKLDC